MRIGRTFLDCNAGRQHVSMQRKRETDCRVASLLAMTGILYTAFSFAKWHFLSTGDPSVACATAPLRGAPRGEAHCQRANAKSLPRSAAPFRGSGASAPKGSPEGRHEQRVKDTVHIKYHRRGRPLCRPDYSIAPAQISLYIAAALDLLAISLTSVTSTLRVRWPNAISMTSPTLT